MAEQQVSKKKKGRPGESRVIYRDGDRERYLWGTIIEENDQGITISRDDGNHEISWDDIKRVDPPKDTYNLSLVIYRDGDRERLLWGTIIEENDWGITISQYDGGDYRIAWDKIKRVDPPKKKPNQQDSPNVKAEI